MGGSPRGSRGSVHGILSLRGGGHTPRTPLGTSMYMGLFSKAFLTFVAAAEGCSRNRLQNSHK